MMIGKIWDAITDPITGYYSDKTRTRWGRRRPYMFVGSVISFFVMGLMFTKPKIVAQMPLFFYMTFLYSLLNTAYTLVNIPYAALLPELTDDYNERTILTGYRMSFAVLGTFVGAAAVIPIVNLFSPNELGWTMMGYFMGTVMLITMLITIWTIKEPTHHKEHPNIGFTETFKEVSSGVSVLALFVGGFLPGFLIAGTLMVMVYFISLKRDYARRKFPTFKEIILSWKEAFFSLLTPVIILVGMFTGIVTPTEAAAVAVVYSAAVGLFIYKTMSFKSFIKDIRDTALFCANTYAIIAASMVLSFIFTRENIGIYLANLVVAAGLSQTLVIFLLLIIVLLLGCFIEVSAMIILIIPILLPIVQAVGYSTLAFGIIFVLTSVLGILTPPFGLGLFIGAEITGMEFWDVFKAVLPFFIPLVIAIILMVFFPQIVTVLPELLLK
jgi:TRAP-type C4-dicarboxylate transport system permease large subunit